MTFPVVILICIIALVLFSLLIALLSRYRKCPSDKVMVIYGKIGSDHNGQQRSAKCLHGGAGFVMPIIQYNNYLALSPISITVD